MKKIQVGVIGLGQIAYGIDKDKKRNIIWSHIGAYNRNKATEVVAVAEPYNKLLNEVMGETGIKSGFLDYKEMLKNSKLDVVSICTPVTTHVEIIKECLKYPQIKAIFCEKVLDYDYQIAKRTVDACAKKGVLLVINHSMRWDSKIQEIKKTIDNNLLGKVKSVVSYANTALFTSSSHVIDVLNYLLGSPLAVTGYKQEDFVRVAHGHNDPGAMAIIEYPQTLVFLKSTSKDDKHLMFEMDFQFEEGRIRFYDNFTKLEFYQFVQNPQNQYLELKLSKTNNIRLNQRTLEIVEEIVNYVRLGLDNVRSTGKTSLETISLINKIIKSSDLKKRIKVS